MSRISSSRARDRLNWPQVYVAVALTTLSTLVLELALTRIFSVVFYYHFAFLAISIALFGLGAGGVLSYPVASRTRNIYRTLGWLAAANSCLVTGSLAYVLSRGQITPTTLGLIYFACAVPFLIAGIVVSLAISETIERVDRVYFADLLGAALGCLALVPFLNSFGGPNAVLISAVLFAVSSSLWFNLGGRPFGRVGGVALALALVALITVNTRQRIIDVRYAKGRAVTGETFVRWNSFSRVAVRPDRYTGAPEILIDADASTGIFPYDLEHLTEPQRRALTLQGPAFVHHLRPGARTLIIGPGGGWDVARALVAGSRHVTGVEINPIIGRTIMREQLPQFSRGLYLRPDVDIVIEDGRSFVRRSTERFDVLQATLVDTWASTAAGAFALSENNLYTVEAFEDYLSHLTENGMLAFTRWGFDPPRESLRLLSLGNAALERLGEREPWRHYIVLREGTSQQAAGWGAQDTVVMARKPISGGDLLRTREFVRAAGMRALYLPDEKIDSEFSRFLHAPDRERFLENYPYDVSPVTDDRPFFFYTVQSRDLVNFFARHRGAADLKINMAVPLLFTVLGISIAATAIVLLLPALTLRERIPRDSGVLGFLLYFVAIGVGYILIQVALIQKFVLYLGHPTYALTVVIFAMLVFSGLGSFWSRRVAGHDGRGLSAVLAATAVVVAVLTLIVGPLTHSGIGWPRWAKVLTTVLVIGPAAFLMGMPFPTALSALERWRKETVRWAWALNAAASVLGSSAALFFALYLGLRATLLCGAAAYLLAYLVWKVRRRDTVKTSATPSAVSY